MKSRDPNATRPIGLAVRTLREAMLTERLVLLRQVGREPGATLTRLWQLNPGVTYQLVARHLRVLMVAGLVWGRADPADERVKVYSLNEESVSVQNRGIVVRQDGAELYVLDRIIPESL